MPVLDIFTPMASGNFEDYLLISWKKNENDIVHEGDVLVILQAEENTFEIHSPSDGVLINILAETNTRIGKGRVLCHLDVMDKKPHKRKKIELERMDNTPSSQLPGEKEIQASSGAQRLADEFDINLEDVLAIGKRITEKDVINFLEERQKKDAEK